MFFVLSSSKYSHVDYQNVSLSCQFSVVVQATCVKKLTTLPITRISWAPASPYQLLCFFCPSPKSRIKLRFYPLWTFTKERFWFSTSWNAFQTSVLSFCYMIIKELQHITKTQISLLMSFGSWQLHHIPNQYFPSQFNLLSMRFHVLRVELYDFIENFPIDDPWMNLLIFECTASLDEASYVCTKSIRSESIVKFFSMSSRVFFGSINSCFDGSDKSWIDLKISVVIQPSQASSQSGILVREISIEMRSRRWSVLMGSCSFDVNPLCHFVCLFDVLAFDVIPWTAPGSYSFLSTEGDSAICAMSYIFLCRTLCVSRVSYSPFGVMKNVARELDVVKFNTEWWTRKCVLCDDHLSEDVRSWRVLKLRHSWSSSMNESARADLTPWHCSKC